MRSGEQGFHADSEASGSCVHSKYTSLGVHIKFELCVILKKKQEASVTVREWQAETVAILFTSTLLISSGNVANFSDQNR